MVGDKEGVGRDDDRLLANSECAGLLAGRFGDRSGRQQAKSFQLYQLSRRPCRNLCEDERDIPKLRDAALASEILMRNSSLRATDLPGRKKALRTPNLVHAEWLRGSLPQRPVCEQLCRDPQSLRRRHCRRSRFLSVRLDRSSGPVFRSLLSRRFLLMLLPRRS
jgi:hypothetical protein